jgi:hypothetical protein
MYARVGFAFPIGASMESLRGGGGTLLIPVLYDEQYSRAENSISRLSFYGF